MSEPTQEMVTITRQEYDRLTQESIFLSYLEAAGIDNWDGYELAKEEMLQEED